MSLKGRKVKRPAGRLFREVEGTLVDIFQYAEVTVAYPVALIETEKGLVQVPAADIVFVKEEAPNDEWLLPSDISNEALIQKIEELNDWYAGNLVKGKMLGNVYYINGFVVLHKDIHTVELAVQYQSYDEVKQDIFARKIKFVTPAREFFDGRFEGAVLNRESKKET